MRTAISTLRGLVGLMVWLSPVGLAADIPRELPIGDRVHTIELNHVYNNDFTKYEFSQWIFWTADQQVIDWKWARVTVVRPSRPPDPQPYDDPKWWRFNHSSQLDKTPFGWRLLYRDRDKLRRIEARCFVESGSNYDVEVARRKRLEVNKRRRLMK